MPVHRCLREAFTGTDTHAAYPLVACKPIEWQSVLLIHRGVLGRFDVLVNEEQPTNFVLLEVYNHAHGRWPIPLMTSPKNSVHDAARSDMSVLSLMRTVYYGIHWLPQCEPLHQPRPHTRPQLTMPNGGRGAMHMTQYGLFESAFTIVANFELIAPTADRETVEPMMARPRTAQKFRTRFPGP